MGLDMLFMPRRDVVLQKKAHDLKCSIMFLGYVSLISAFPCLVFPPFLPHASRLGPREGSWTAADGRGKRGREREAASCVGTGFPFGSPSLPGVAKYVGPPRNAYICLPPTGSRPRSALSRISQASLSLSHRLTDGGRPCFPVYRGLLMKGLQIDSF